jgi:hypothetical protein
LPDGSKLLVLDNDSWVYVYDAAGSFLHRWRTSGVTRPQGIATDGTDVWIVSTGTDRVYFFTGGASHVGGTHSATSSFALGSGNAQPNGITTDGASLWVVDDASTRRVFKYTTTGAPLGNWQIDPANRNPRGITIDPANVSDIWIVDDQAQNTVFRYAGAASRTTGSQSAADTFSLAAANSSPQGIADPRLGLDAGQAPAPVAARPQATFRGSVKLIRADDILGAGSRQQSRLVIRKFGRIAQPARSAFELENLPSVADEGDRFSRRISQGEASTRGYSSLVDDLLRRSFREKSLDPRHDSGLGVKDMSFELESVLNDVAEETVRRESRAS